MLNPRDFIGTVLKGISGFFARLFGSAKSESAKEQAPDEGSKRHTDDSQAFKNRLAAAFSAVKGNPRIVIAICCIVGAICVSILVVSIAMIPPKLIESETPGPPNIVTRNLFETLIVPFDDPLAVPIPVDRPRKTRYTHEDVEQKWKELGEIDTTGIKRKNIADLESIFSAVE
jgi:hypothetical protein